MDQITIPYDIACAIYDECERYIAGEYFPDDNSVLRLKSREIFPCTTGNMAMTMTCNMVFRALASYYMNYKSELCH